MISTVLLLYLLPLLVTYNFIKAGLETEPLPKELIEPISLIPFIPIVNLALFLILVYFIIYVAIKY